MRSRATKSDSEPVAWARGASLRKPTDPAGHPQRLISVICVTDSGSADFENGFGVPAVGTRKFAT